MEKKDKKRRKGMSWRKRTERKGEKKAKSK